MRLSRNKIKVVQQSLSLSVLGGTTSEFKALQHSSLGEAFEFIPMVLTDYKRGINIHDILFYYRFLKCHTYDIVHIRGAGPDCLNCVIAAKLAGKGKILVTIHGLYSDLIYISPLKKWFSKNIVERLNLALADGISCVCEAAEKRPYFEKYRHKMLPYVYNRIPEFQIEQQPMMRDKIRKQYHISDKDTVALFMGRVTREKGLEVLLEALKTLDGSVYEHFTLLIAGDGDYLPQLKAECGALTNKIIFTGFVGNTEEFYAAADFFLLPTLHENHSISLLEAAAAGLPAICTDCGGNAEIVKNGVTGVLVPVFDSEKLKNAILQMLDIDFRADLKKNLQHDNFSKFSNAAVDEKLSGVYRLLLK